ncbi:hypothetical protein PKOR_03485 [Pontibacter korlensis]|uniref:SGNH hydrolase-type esterase domain-containing protein n=2 Tax=Pontibacter korlensis TaxID=400092 RepID=A0A0E3UYW0_9BACT|nr:hypothetical protein PKOR_03485 [Pontibacter korlensis]
MTLGNSITQGNLEHPGYRYRLWQKLVDADVDVEFVGSHDTNFGGDPAVKNIVYKGRTYTNRNEGHWGWSADEILNGKAGEGNLVRWLQTYTPDIALIHLGTNDMFRQCGDGSDCYEQTIDELRQVVQQIRGKNPAVTIILAQLIPAYSQKVGPAIADNIVELNKRIPGLVQELNTAASPVILVDQYSGFDATEGVDTWDGVHPNASGEEKMAQKWFDAMNLLVTPQPVELSFFKASLSTNNDVQLEWQTASETNNAYFEIQRSTDGNEFSPQGKVAGAGTTVTMQHYTFTDTLTPSGLLYYRLKQVDTDSTSTFSKVVQVEAPKQEQALRVYPTSSRGHSIALHLQHKNTTDVANVHIYTIDGKLVQKVEKLKGNNGTYRTQIATSLLQGAGLYLVRVMAGDKQYYSEFIVER